jgi:hypothetical protein
MPGTSPGAECGTQAIVPSLTRVSCRRANW